MSSIIQRMARVVFAVVVLTTAVHAQQTLQDVPAELVAHPDLILYNGKIVTMDDASLNNSPGRIVEAMAVRGDRIQFLGSAEEILRYAGPPTRKIDLKGRTVVPGLINTHSHMHDHSLQLWVRSHPEEVETLMKRFSVSGDTFEELTRGIEVVIKENMAHPLPGQWAWIDLPTGGSSGTGIGIQYLIKEEMTRKELDAARFVRAARARNLLAPQCERRIAGFSVRLDGEKGRGRTKSGRSFLRPWSGSAQPHLCAGTRFAPASSS